MNILPKKRWHVRTKDNIARVRRDEAAAREEERKRQEKLELAESESRINFLRRQSGLPETSVSQSTKETNSSEDVNQTSFDLFADHKSHIKKTNKEHEKEKKEEKEKYEKQIGYLTYLGQDTNEALKLRSWYEVAPKRRNKNDDDRTNIEEKDLKAKFLQDPLTLINSLVPHEKGFQLKRDSKRMLSPSRSVSAAPSQESLSSPKTKNKHKKHKKEKKHKQNNEHNFKKQKKANFADELETAKREKLEKLRRERLNREAAERARQEALFGPPKTPAESKVESTPRIVQKYNSQFNPEFAKQNIT